MKRIIFTLTICAAFIGSASAQLIPSFQFGAKAGVNLSSFSTEGTLSSNNRAGYLAGFWARVGGAGVHFQPELYLTSKNVKFGSGSQVNDAKFTSIDVPLLVGTKIGALGVGGRFNTGPLVSFAINKDQNFGSAVGNATRLNYKDQNFAWQFGAGLDFQKVSLDLRYELGLTKQTYEATGDKTRVNLWNLTLGYRLFSL
jgi:hypothetical protein